MFRIARRTTAGTTSILLAMAGSLLIGPAAIAKRGASFDMPTCEKLLEGDGPDTARENRAPSKSGKQDLAPMNLVDEKQGFSVGGDGKVKMEVQQNVTVQSGAPSADPTSEKSVVGQDEKLKKKLLKDSQQVNVAPIALMETEGEAQKKADTISDAEKSQLTDLWTATINKSPDIQFVINKLQPTTDQGHATAKALQLIGGALFSAVQMAPLMMPGGANMGMMMGTSSGVSLLQSLMNEQTGKSMKKNMITQEQATMLYTIVRNTAEKVVTEYRRYRHNRNEFERANRDLEDLKAMVASAHRTADPAKQIDMEYTIRKAQRDVDRIVDEARLHRSQLVDLAGSDAVARLDGQMEEETVALARLTGSGEPAPGQELRVLGPKTAAKEGLKLPDM